MSLANLLNQPCTITHQAQTGAVDDYGNPTWETTTTETVCYAEQRRTEEDTLDQSTGTEEWRVLIPAGVTVADQDRLNVDGLALEVYGPPWPVWNPRTRRVSHVEIRARQVS